MGKDAEFDRYAEDYERMLRDPMREAFAASNEFFHRRRWILIADFFKRRGIATGGLSWLDVGCGKGELLRYGIPYFRRVVGCERSREMIRGTGGAETYWQEAPDRLAFPDASFDFITAVCVYHHVEESHRGPLTGEIHRVLRPNGVCCIIEHNPFNPATRLIVHRSPIDIDADLLTSRRARRYLKSAGFRDVECEYFLYFPERFFDRLSGIEGALGKLPLGGQYATFAGK